MFNFKALPSLGMRLILVVALFCCLQAPSPASASGNRVRLTDIQTLTLQHDKYTTGRRSSPVKQLKCVSDSRMCRDHAPKTVQCYNKGHDGVDVQWQCNAQLDDKIKFDTMKVSCEGYDNPEDPYVLAGSCGLEYTLVTSSGKGSDTPAPASGSRVKLTDIQTLTLQHDKYTTGRRSSPVKQLKCASSSRMCKDHAPTTVQCYNKGHDGLDVQWQCTAQLDDKIKFDTMKVSCEGYENPEDPYVLAGSCGLEYTLTEGSGKSNSQDTPSASGNRVKLTDIQMLTLNHDKYTTGRRSSPVKQLKCASSSRMCNEHAPKTVQCYNKGHDGLDVQWQCNAALDDKIKFDTMKVSCEGYENPEDPYVLAGSCGLEYTLMNAPGKTSDSHFHKHHNTEKHEGTGHGLGWILPAIGMLGLVGLVLMCMRGNHGPHHTTPSAPHLNPRPTPSYGFKTTEHDKSYMMGTEHQQPQQTAQAGEAGWGSFLKGAAVGAAASHLLTKKTTTTTVVEPVGPVIEDSKAPATTVRRGAPETTTVRTETTTVRQRRIDDSPPPPANPDASTSEGYAGTGRR